MRQHALSALCRFAAPDPTIASHPRRSVESERELDDHGSRRSARGSVDPARPRAARRHTWRMDEGLRWEKAPRCFSGRGLAYWTDGREERVIVVTAGYHLVALEVRTGRQVAGFGEHGVVDLMKGLGYELVPWAGEPGPMQTSGARGPVRAESAGPGAVWGIDPAEGQIGASSPPIVVGDVIVVGNSTIQGYYLKYPTNIPGHIRGFDVRTGKPLWTFRLTPYPGEFGYDSWDPEGLEGARARSMQPVARPTRAQAARDAAA